MALINEVEELLEALAEIAVRMQYAYVEGVNSRPF